MVLKDFSLLSLGMEFEVAQEFIATMIILSPTWDNAHTPSVGDPVGAVAR